MTEPPARPVADLGLMDSYAPLADLDLALGSPSTDATRERRNLCLLLATRYVAYRVGAVVTDTEVPVPLVGDVSPVPARPAWRRATVAAGVRFFKSEEVPFGVAGGWDMATYVRQSIPDVDLMLYGQRTGFGIA